MGKIINGDCLEVLKTFPDESVDCCVTSPPYYGLRDYGVNGQIGLEATPEEYIEKLTGVFHEVKRVLKSDGTLWVNIGDTYFNKKNECGMKQKDLIGIPWMLAFSLRADGWYLRQDIIWHKPNPMPESVKDRCTKSHEYIFLLSKSKNYYFDAEAISEPVAESTIERLSQNIEKQKGSNRVPGKTNGAMKAVSPRFGGNKYGNSQDVFSRTKSGNEYEFRPRRNRHDVWTVSTTPFNDAHFATYPEKLVKPCILAGCRVGGVVLDPFFGSGTTGRVAEMLGRTYLGIELNSEYIEIANKRTNNVQLSLESLMG